MIPNFVFASKEHLRNGVNFSELELNEEEQNLFQNKNHVPAAIVQMMSKRLQAGYRNGLFTAEELIIIDHNLNALLDSLGACERIRNTLV